MPLYHFHIHCAGDFIRDEEGCNRLDLHAAVAEAVRSLRSLVCGDIAEGKIQRDMRIQICDHQGGHLRNVTFEDAIRTIGAAARPASANDG